MPSSMKRVSLELPAELLKRVDEVAGDIPRNRWIRRAIETALAEAIYGPGATTEFKENTTK